MAIIVRTKHLLNWLDARGDEPVSEGEVSGPVALYAFQVATTHYAPGSVSGVVIHEPIALEGELAGLFKVGTLDVGGALVVDIRADENVACLNMKGTFIGPVSSREYYEVLKEIVESPRLSSPEAMLEVDNLAAEEVESATSGSTSNPEEWGQESGNDG